MRERADPAAFLEPVAEAVAAAAYWQPLDPGGGQWWSTPVSAAVDTSRALPGLGSVGLVWQEDSLGFRDAAVWPLRVTGPVRVHEIDSPDAWVRLVAAYPLPVSNARRHEWYQAAGRAGAWHIPDWAAVAVDFDAVHFSVAGYLATAGRALPLPGGEAATVLAGCGPDQTWWPADVLAVETTTPETWHNHHRNTHGPDWRPTRS